MRCLFALVAVLFRLLYATEPKEVLSGVRRARRGVHAGIEIHRAKVQAGETDALISICWYSNCTKKAIVCFFVLIILVVRCPRAIHGLSVRCLRAVRVLSVCCPWPTHGLTVGFLWAARGLCFPWVPTSVHQKIMLCQASPTRRSQHDETGEFTRNLETKKLAQKQLTSHYTVRRTIYGRQ